MPEVDQRTYEDLVGAYKLLDAVMRNPETKDDAYKVLKKLNPKVSIPEHDVKTSLEDKFAKLTEKVEGFIKGEQAKKETETYQQQWSSAIDKHIPGLTEDGQQKLMDLMKERQIRDPEAGALLWKQLNPPAEPTTSSGWMASTMFDPSPETDLGEWFKNPDKKRDQEIAAVLAGR